MRQESFAQQGRFKPTNLHRWRKKYEQMDEVDANRLNALEKEPSEAR